MAVYFFVKNLYRGQRDELGSPKLFPLASIQFLYKNIRTKNISLIFLFFLFLTEGQH